MSVLILAALAAATVASSSCHVERSVGTPDGPVLGLPVERSQDDGTVQGGIKLAEPRRVATAKGQGSVLLERSEAPATPPASSIKVERSVQGGTPAARGMAQTSASLEPAGSASGEPESGAIPVFRSEQSPDQSTSC